MLEKDTFEKKYQNFSFPDEEQRILKYWKEIDAFKQQLALNRNLPPFIFYDGPPFTTGPPHFGHVAVGTIKDVICRYAAQTGHYVERRFGWDCHGLPVEHQINKEFKITKKAEVYEMGIKKYNDYCKNLVQRYWRDWEKIFYRFGRWGEFENDYKTMNLKYMESVWHIFKEFYQKGLIYKEKKIVPYSVALNTALSNFQVSRNYRQTNDPSVFIAFSLKKEPTVNFLVWTCAPWTLLSNLALAVNPGLVYVKVKDLTTENVYILAESRLKDSFKKQKFEIIQKYIGADLVGLEYEPLFDFFIQRQEQGCFRVHAAASFIDEYTGTGVVYLTPSFNETHYNFCMESNLINTHNSPQTLDDNGYFTKQVPPYEGIYFKDADKIVISDLKDRGKVFRLETIRHDYPFCWRSETPLIFKLATAWFVNITAIKEDLIKSNIQANWIPKIIKEKLYQNWIKDAKDWCISRTRFWGNPIPLWVSEDGEEIVCVGSLRQLYQLTGENVTDMHRESIDHLIIQSKQGKGKLKRIEEVFDCWFESGCMPFAQVHYPFSTSEEEFKKMFPADFIAEGIDQTRGWFYTLSVISTGLRRMGSFKNLIVNGLVLKKESRKLMKRQMDLSPLEVSDKFGADAIRIYLMSSPLTRADNLNVHEEGVKGIARDVLIPWLNSYRFLRQNVIAQEKRNGKSFTYNEKIEDLFSEFSVLDKWILSSLHILINNYRTGMSEFKIYDVMPALLNFLNLFTNWYIKLNRPHIQGDYDNMEVTLNILFDTLFKFNLLMSPFAPFFSERTFQNLRDFLPENSQLNLPSIHFLSLPESNPFLIDIQYINQMSKVIQIIENAKNLKQKMKMRQSHPITSLTLVNKNPQIFEGLKPFLAFIKQQVNVQNIYNEINTQRYIKLYALPNVPVLGPKFKGNKDFKDIKAAITNFSSQQIVKFTQGGPIRIQNYQLTINDLIIQHKFQLENLSEFQIIGGKNLFVIVNFSQKEELRLLSFTQKLIQGIKKLIMKSCLTPYDSFLVFYRFEGEAKYLNEAITKRMELITQAVKKPIIKNDQLYGLFNLSKESGSIGDQHYNLIITSPGPILNYEALKMSFSEKGIILAQALLSFPFEKVKSSKQIRIRLDGKDFILESGKHYTIVE